MQNSMRLAGESRRAVTKRIPFNISNLAHANCPSGRTRTYIFDVQTPGLALMVTDKGSKSFYLVRRINGRPERIRIGGFPEVSVEQARNSAMRWHGQVAGGLDPVAERKKISKSITLGELWDKWKADHADQRLRQRTIDTDQSRFVTCLGGWTTRKISSIKESDIRSLHAELGRTRGRVTANRAVQLLKRLFNFARLEPNPAAGRAVEMFRETPRSRFLQPDELSRLFKVLDESEPTVRDFIHLSLFTGQRRSNMMSMRWDEIDLVARTWTIPAEKTKAHQQNIVPLTPPAISALDRRRSSTGDSPYVFPGKGTTGHLVEPKGAWKGILKRAGISGLTLHDLRRTTASWMAIGGTSLPIIGAALGHKSPTATAIYARLHGSAVAQSLDQATAAMLEAGKGDGDAMDGD